MSVPDPVPVIALRPSLQAYAWGDRSFIRGQLGLDAGTEPCAEAWFGAHPSAPSHSVDSGAALDDLVAEQGPALLGEAVAARFGELPYLLKLLSAARPLSIQVHPDARQAAAGFAREEAAGIDRAAPERNYRDARAKPELIVALTPFEALCGFRALDDLAARLAAVPELRDLLPADVADAAELEALVAAWFALPGARIEAAQAALLARLAATPPAAADDPGHLALRVHRSMEGGAAADRGLLFVFLLEHRHLAPGEGLFLAAGVPHAYLHGSGIEVMANSDNVLRGGLTPKHVDADELLRILRWDAQAPAVLHAEGVPLVDQDGAADAGLGVYRTPAAEFELACIRLGTAGMTRVAEGPETLLLLADDCAAAGVVLETFGDADADGARSLLARGSACLVPHGRRYRLTGAGARVWRVSVPPPV